MENLWLKIKIWTKIGLLAILSLYVLAFVFKNSDQAVTIWWWVGKEFHTSALELMLISLVAGAVMAVALRMAMRAVSQIRELRERNASARLHRNMAEINAKADLLQTKPTTIVVTGDSAGTNDAAGGGPVA